MGGRKLSTEVGMTACGNAGRGCRGGAAGCHGQGGAARPPLPLHFIDLHPRAAPPFHPPGATPIGYADSMLLGCKMTEFKED